MFSFMQHFFGVKGKQLGKDIVEAIVSIDPESASQAQLLQMETDLDKAGMVLQKIRADLDREVREAEAATKRYDQMMSAAEHLQARIDDPATTDKASIEASLAKLVTQLEEFAPQVEQERRDVVEVQALLDEAQAAYKAKAAALSGAKQHLDRAKHDMQRATIQQERAEEKARRAAEIAGLRGDSGNKLTIAVDAMSRRAEEARAKAAAASMKAETLSLTSAKTDDDPNIVAAMKLASGGAVSGSLTDRLAALKKK
ncbi:MAG: hypothetical protein HQL33_09700 [Alphaproteobacteria bacterium]|nr:hypothetical protein [Alphaproteobacteria bacterium]